MKLDNSQLTKIINTSITIQQKLFNRLESEEGQSKEFTAHQIIYQKRVYKAAMHHKHNCYVVDGIKPVSDEEMLKYYNQLIEKK